MTERQKRIRDLTTQLMLMLPNIEASERRVSRAQDELRDLIVRFRTLMEERDALEDAELSETVAR